MRTLRNVSLAAIVICLFSSTLTGQNLTEEDRAAIEKLNQNIDQGITSKNSALYLSSFAENAVQFGPDTTILRGKTEIAKNATWIDDDPEAPSQQRKTTIEEIDGNGDVAYLWETSFIETTWGERTVETSARALKIARKQSDGSWLFTVDMYNYDILNSQIEIDINAIGYKLLGKKEYEKAARIFELNVEYYPDSFNVYDSLGEAYFNLGKHDLALKNYQKSLELNPENTNAEEMIKKIQSQNE